MFAGIVYGMAVWAIVPGILFSILVTVWGLESPFPWGSVYNLVGHLVYGFLLGGLVSVFVDLEHELREADAPFEEPSNPPTEQ
jgi:Na+/proline symporter